MLDQMAASKNFWRGLAQRQREVAADSTSEVEEDSLEEAEE